MGIKDMLQNMGKKNNERKELLRRIDSQVRMEKIVAERQLSSNERELNRIMNEKREQSIKEELEFRRKERADDINFGHNALDTKNIMKSEWEIMKEKSQFSGNKNMFVGQKSVLKSDRNILKSKKIKSKNLFKI